MKTNEAGVSLIKQFEGLVDGDPKTPGLDPYICPTGYATIGYGHVIRDGGKMLRGVEGLARAKQIQAPITEAEADALLLSDLKTYEAEVERLTAGLGLNVNQFSALVSFAFNLGAPNLSSSTLLRKLREGDFAAAADQFGVWIKGTVEGQKVTLPGLVRRREAERQLFLKPVLSPTQDRATIAAGVAVVAAIAGAAPELMQDVSVIQGAFDAIGVTVPVFKWVMSALTTLSAGFGIYSRVTGLLRKGQ